VLQLREKVQSLKLVLDLVELKDRGDEDEDPDERFFQNV